MALLPLANATDDPAERYHADGVTEALNAQLGAAADVRIISPASASLVARTAKTPADIADPLGASVIVDGSVRRVADRVLVDVRPVHSADGRVLWSESFQRRTGEVLSLQAEVVNMFFSCGFGLAGCSGESHAPVPPQADAQDRPERGQVARPPSLIPPPCWTYRRL